MAKHADGELQVFAGKVEIDLSTVSLLYNDHREVTDRYAIRIANRLNVPPPDDMAIGGILQRAGTDSSAPKPSGVTVPLEAFEEAVRIGKANQHLLTLVLDRADRLAEALEQALARLASLENRIG